jgi:RNA polymerase sigma factor (sigma-70 family)
LENNKNNTELKITDNEVIERVVNGDKDLYELIMRKYNQRLFRIGRSIIHDEEEVEDIIQDAYIKAYENLRNFQHRSQFSTWLTRILINEALARKNQMKRMNVVYHQTEDNGETNDFNNKEYYNMPSNLPNPEEETINNELKVSLEKVIDNLPEKYRTVYVMREIEGMNIAETSECLNISESNVKVRLNRAKEMLRDSLTNIYQESEVFQFMGTRCDRIVTKVLNKIK